MKTFKEYINEGEISKVALLLKDLFKKINPHDNKNYVQITAKSKGAVLSTFTIAYDTLDGKVLTQDEVNDLWDNDREASDRTERHQLILNKVKKGFKVNGKIPAKGDLSKYNGKTLTDEEAVELIKELPING